MASCSSMNDWDVSKIIQKTESWLFYEEGNSSEKDADMKMKRRFSDEKVK